jgi:amino acid permease
LCLPANTSGGASGKIVILIVMILLYWMCMAVYLAFARVKQKVDPPKTEYKSVFKK